MKTFCTEGPVDPVRNYFVSRKSLLKQGLAKVDDWRYFTLFAPRQSGKSTYFQFLVEYIRQEGRLYLPLWLSFEAYSDFDMADFISRLSHDLMLELETVEPERTVSSPFLKKLIDLSDWFRTLTAETGKEIVLIIDEMEGLSDLTILNKFLHLVRFIYHKRRQIGLRSVILVGVSNITGILQDTASPFNIADQIDIPYFTFDETADLLAQHTRETGQVFLPEVIQGIYDNTAGQPGLVNALARDLVEKRCPDMAEIGMEPFYQTLDAFMRVYVNKNISNVVNKARQYPEIMMQVLFDGPINFTAYDDRLSFLRVNGVIVDEAGQCAIPVPIYKKCLYQAFKPLLNGNGEMQYFRDPMISIRHYLLPNGRLDMVKVLNRYAEYIAERGNVIFSGGKAREGIYHYNLDAYLSSFVEFLGGRVFPEVPEGGGRVDLLVLQDQMRWIVEVKRFRGPDLLDRGKRQLSAYVNRSGLAEGYLVVFSDVHPEGSRGEEMVDGVRVHWWILPVNVIPPSRC
jgi:hypothetical protein